MMRKTDFAFWTFLLMTGMAGVATVASITQTHSATSANSDLYRQLDLFGDVLERVRSDYVEKPDDTQLIESAIRKKGFSSVEVLSNCHTQFGRRNKMASPVRMLEWFKENAVRMHATSKMKPEELEGKFIIGVLADSERPSYNEEYEKVRDRAKGNNTPKPPVRCEG